MAILTIAGVPVANPAEIKISRFDLTKSNRTASGRMVMEVVRAGVRRVDVTWRYLPDSDLKTILDVLAANKPYFQVTFPGPSGTETMTAYAGDVTTTLWHTRGGVRYWSEVSVPFIEV